MRCACIDIGSNTTRLLVADVEQGRLSDVAADKAFTRLGRELRRTGALPLASLELVAGVVERQAAAARAAGAQRLRVVATAAIRQAANGDELRRVVGERAGVPVDVLTGEEEARLAFAGATRAGGLPGGRLPERVAVVDVGGGSSEIAVGRPGGGVEWSVSVPIGSASLAEAFLRTDPPRPEDLDAARTRATAAFAELDVPTVDLALAVGGSATSTARLVGRRIGRREIDVALATLTRAPAEDVAREHGLEAERVRLLPAGLHLLEAALGRLGCVLEVGCGGIREGVCLDAAGVA